MTSKLSYLNSNEVQLINSINDQKLLAVNYYYWINSAKPAEEYFFIDVVEMVFQDHPSLFFKINDEDSGINVTTEFEFEHYNKHLQLEFQQQIKLKKVAVTESNIWQSVIQNSLQKTDLKEVKGQFLSSYFIFDFKSQKIELSFHPVEGLLVAEYEDTFDN